MSVVALLLSYSTMPSGVTVPNERSRVYLAVAMVDHGTFAIDKPVARFGHIYDIARHDGHFYSDKAPGSSFVGAAVYGVLRLFTEADAWSIQELIGVMRRGLMVPLGVFGFLMLRRVLRQTGVVAPIGDLVSVGWILGTSAFHYSGAFFGHQIVAVVSIAALASIHAAEHRRGSQSLLLAGLGGLFMGIAGLTEYQAGVVAVLLGLYVLLGPPGRLMRGVGYALGGLPGLVLLGWYNTQAFGGPLELPYHHLPNPALAQLHGQGIGGVTTPTGEAFFGGMLSLHRGLFVTSPMFLFVIPGLVRAWRAGRRRLSVLLGLVGVYFVLFISSSSVWAAGWGFGPRLLIPAMPFLALLVAHGAQGLHRFAIFDALFRGSVIAGVLYHQCVRAFFPEPPDDAHNPILDVVWSLYQADLVAPNVIASLQTGVVSLVPLAIVVSGVVLWVSIRRMRARALFARAFVLLASGTVLAALSLYVGLSGPSWSDKKRRDFTAFVRGLEGTPTPAPR